MKNKILKSLLILSTFVLMGCSNNENLTNKDINSEINYSQTNVVEDEERQDLTIDEDINEDNNEDSKDANKEDANKENDIDSNEDIESDNTNSGKVIYEGNEQMIQGIARVVAHRMILKNEYRTDSNKYFYSENDFHREMVTTPFQSVFNTIYYDNNDGNEVLDSKEVINTLNSVFNTHYTDADVEKGDWKLGDWKLEDGKIIRNDKKVIYPQYVGKWDEENSTYNIEIYYCSNSYAAENEPGIGGYYYEYCQSAAVKFMPADNDLGFAVESVEILKDYNSMAGNPWCCYNYRKEEDFLGINNINWNDLLFGNISGEEDALADYMSVLDCSENVLLFSELNSSNNKEVKLDKYKVNCIAFGDINSDNTDDMIMSVYTNGEWRMMVVSHIDGQYYAHLFNKFAFMDISKSGYYYSAVGNTTDKYDIKKLDITKDGFTETVVGNYNGYDKDAVLDGKNVPNSDLFTWEYNNMGPMVRFWDVKKSDLDDEGTAVEAMGEITDDMIRDGLNAAYIYFFKDAGYDDYQVFVENFYEDDLGKNHPGYGVVQFSFDENGNRKNEVYGTDSKPKPGVTRAMVLVHQSSNEEKGEINYLVREYVVDDEEGNGHYATIEHLNYNIKNGEVSIDDFFHSH